MGGVGNSTFIEVCLDKQLTLILGMSMFTVPLSIIASLQSSLHAV